MYFLEFLRIQFHVKRWVLGLVLKAIQIYQRLNPMEIRANSHKLLLGLQMGIPLPKYPKSPVLNKASMKFAFGYGKNLGPNLDMSMLDLDPNTPQRFHVGTSYGFEFESLKTDLSLDPPWIHPR